MVSTAGGAGSKFSPQGHLLNIGGTVDTQLKKHSLARSASAATAHAGVWGNVISVAVRTRTATSSLVRAHSCGDRRSRYVRLPVLDSNRQPCDSQMQTSF